jgi:hypothetical protein
MTDDLYEYRLECEGRLSLDTDGNTLALTLCENSSRYNNIKSAITKKSKDKASNRINAQNVTDNDQVLAFFKSKNISSITGKITIQGDKGAIKNKLNNTFSISFEINEIFFEINEINVPPKVGGKNTRLEEFSEFSELCWIKRRSKHGRGE